MSETKFELQNVKKIARALRKRQKKYRGASQKDTGEFLDLVRRTAADQIMINPPGKTYSERKKTKSTPGKLTNRTGRMKYLLKQNAGTWVGNGKVIYKRQTSAFKMQSRVIRVGKSDSGFIATIRIYISNIPYKVAWIGKGRPLPMATKLTIKMRFLWEGRGRPYLNPAAKLQLAKFRYKLQSSIDTHLGGVV